MFAQETLNIHTKSSGVVSISFTEKPEISFGDNDIMKIVSSQVSVEYPFSDVDQITFENSPSRITEVVHYNASSGIAIYNMSGVLIKKYDVENGKVSFDWNKLSPGIYIIKNGSRVFKINKK